MPKRLALDVHIIKPFGGSTTYYFIRVKEQTHKVREFGDDNETSFTASNGYRLCSSGSIDIGRTTGYVRGSSADRDDKVVSRNSRGVDINKLILAVKEYNKKFNGSPIIFEPIPDDGIFTIK